MHYRNNAFSKNGKPTLIARGNPSLKFGQRKFFSQGDVHQINTLYQCDNQETTNNISQAVPVTRNNFQLVEDHY